jgi:hydrogenase expression/formation protein HypD
MKYLDEYRDYASVQRMAQQIRRTTTRPWTLMEVCGGQTYTIVKSGLEELLPSLITLVHGPGCPVCVTPVAMIDRAVATALLPQVILCSFGDMLRVPGSVSGEKAQSLLDAKALGADVRIVYSPLDALALARAHPTREVVFFAVGFETTAPANAMAIWQAEREEIRNFSMLVSHVLVPPAMEAVLQSPQCRVQAFLAAGHACMVTGYEEYCAIAQQYNVPIVVTGFEPLDLLEGVLRLVAQLESGQASVENQYTRAVEKQGNRPAQARVAEVFEVTHRAWRGIGEIARSGLRLRERYRSMDAEAKFGLQLADAAESSECIAGQVLQGLRRPYECSAFGTRCTPDRPLGAPMVSSEGACAAYYHFGRKSHHVDPLVSLTAAGN